MDAIVQLLRNFFCCIKDLNLFTDTLPSLYDPTLLSLPAPHHNTTPLESLIGLTQFYAFVSVSLAGWGLLRNGWGRYRTRRRVAKQLKGLKSTASSSPAGRLVTESVKGALARARREVVTGLCVFPIGIAFFWLTANSFHVTETGWIGGLAGLIHALEVMEVGLLVLLVYMINDVFDKWAQGERLGILSGVLSDGKSLKGVMALLTGGGVAGGVCLNEEVYGWLCTVEQGGTKTEAGWKPFWAKDDVHRMTSSDNAITASLTKEMETVSASLDKFSNGTKNKGDDDDDKLIKAALQDTATTLSDRAEELRKEGCLDLFYFVVNSIAFYGYALCVVVYYFQDEGLMPNYVYYTKLGMANADADWRGNFAGDLMWTIEPFVILGGPLWVKSHAKSDKKRQLEKKTE